MHQPSKHKAAGAHARALCLLAALAATGAATAQQPSHPVTAAQRATAQQTAQNGIPVAELAANAPKTYVVKRGDTL